MRRSKINPTTAIALVSALLLSACAGQKSATDHTSDTPGELLNSTPAFTNYYTQPEFLEVGMTAGLTEPQTVGGQVGPADYINPKEKEFRVAHCEEIKEIAENSSKSADISGIVYATQMLCDVVHLAAGAAAINLVGSELPDILLTRVGGHPLLYRNDGDFKFTDVSTQTGFSSITENTSGIGVADIDNDGDLDVFFTTTLEYKSVLMVNQGNEFWRNEADNRGVAMETGTLHFGTGVMFGDYNNDGWVDLHTAEWVPPGTSATSISHSRLFKNLGAEGKPGVFLDSTKEAGVGMERPNLPVVSFGSVLHDFDEDGHKDLVIISDFGLTEYFWSNGDGTFTKKASTARFEDQNGMGFDYGDVDGDGSAELFITAIYSAKGCGLSADVDAARDLGREASAGFTGARLFKYAGDRIFMDMSKKAGVSLIEWGWGTNFADLRNTGFLDIVAVGGQWQTASLGNPETNFDSCFVSETPKVWVNDGTGHFVDVAQNAGMSHPITAKGVAHADFDGDGLMDILITREYTNPLLYKNTTKTKNNYVKLSILNEHGSFYPTARVEVYLTKNSPKITRWSGPRSSFLTASEPTLHLGLGRAGSIYKVDVFFSDGTKRTLSELIAGETYVIQK